MKRCVALLITCSFSIIALVASAQQFTLVNMGSSKSKIIIPEQPSVIEIQAAKVFQDYIHRISDAKIEIASDKLKPAAGEILIGKVNREEMNEVPLEKLGMDGVYISNNGKKLIITGGAGNGVLYGVYTFLEKYMGCRKYSSKVTFVPKQKTILLKPVKDLQVPTFTYRDDFYPDVINDPEYMAWHKLDNCFGRADSGNEWGAFVHTFDHLLGTGEYGTAHPEYFAFYDGKRHPEQKASGAPESQLCLSNPAVLEIVCNSLKKDIEKNPTAIYWSVSQNDNVNYCRCAECSRIDSMYAAFAPGTKNYLTHSNTYVPIGMGSILTFVNKVAARFPDKTISTLAYQYSRVAPKNMVPAKNVNIMLCNIESPRHVSIEKGDTAFSRDMEEWAKITNNIIIWDYVVQYRNLVSPFPNLHTLQPNLQYLRDKGVPMIFEEGNPEMGGEFHELKAYLIAKLLWNADADVDAVIKDFLTGYYGQAAKPIGDYINLLEKNLKESGSKLLIYGTPVEEKTTFLSDSMMSVYNKLFDDAERVVAASPELLKRVQVARLPLYFAELEIARDEKTGKRGAFLIGENNTLIPKQEVLKRLYDFAYFCINTNVSHLREGRITPQQYLNEYTKFIKENSTERKVSLSGSN